MSLRLEPSAALREKRLKHLLGERGIERADARLGRLVEDAFLVGCLELAGVRVTWEETRSEAQGPPELAALRRARAAVPPSAMLTVDAIRAWHSALAGPVGLRRSDPETRAADVATSPPRPAAAPAAFIEERLASLTEWIEAQGTAELQPEQKAAVALARIVEIRPFDDANGRVSRLAAAHLLGRAGLGPPILVGGDAARLRAALDGAFRLETSALVELVREASGRALDVMIQSIERRLL